MPKTRALALYMPVLHRGYMQLFEEFNDVDQVYVFDDELLKSVDYLRKDLRALSPEQQVMALNGLGRFKAVEILTKTKLNELNDANVSLIFADEDISREIASSLKDANVQLYPVFLRWDRGSVENADMPSEDEKVTADRFQQDIMQAAMKRAGTSSDIWRRVGAVLIAKDNTRMDAANQGEPSAHSPWMEGDPRNIFHRGVAIEMSVFTHAEATLIAEAARRGVALKEASIYVTTFPCPACAKLIAHSGIKTCYYKDGYAVLDGASVMKEYGVELVRVQLPEEPNSKNPEAVPYKS